MTPLDAIVICLVVGVPGVFVPRFHERKVREARRWGVEEGAMQERAQLQRSTDHHVYIPRGAMSYAMQDPDGTTYAILFDAERDQSVCVELPLGAKGQWLGLPQRCDRCAMRDAADRQNAAFRGSGLGYEQAGNIRWDTATPEDRFRWMGGMGL